MYPHCTVQCTHCKKSFLKIQEYIHEGANLKLYIPEFFNLSYLFLNIHLLYIELLVPNCRILFLRCSTVYKL
jgi:hypothetical protein